jgi:hypothetical protein
MVRNRYPGAGVDGRFPSDWQTQTTKRELRMWISLFAFAAGAAICLSVVAIMMQPATEGPSRGQP